MIFVTVQAQKENGSPVRRHSTAGPESVSPTQTITILHRTITSGQWLCRLFFLVESIQLLMDAPELFHQLLVFLHQ